jgi:hypothetical protein
MAKRKNRSGLETNCENLMTNGSGGRFRGCGFCHHPYQFVAT